MMLIIRKMWQNVEAIGLAKKAARHSRNLQPDAAVVSYSSKLCGGAQNWVERSISKDAAGKLQGASSCRMMDGSKRLLIQERTAGTENRRIQVRMVSCNRWSVT